MGTVGSSAINESNKTRKNEGQIVKKRTIIIIAAAATVTAAVGVGIFSWLTRGNAAQAVNATPLSVGEKYLAELNYEKATAALEEAISVEPNNTEAYLALARAYNYMGDIDTARETLENGYAATNSTVIQRRIEELIQTESPADVSEPAGTARYIEIAGQNYPEDTKELILRSCGLTDADMAKLAEFTSLERLDISGNGISDISVVGQLATLKKFYAANNAISDISPLGGLPALEYAGLRGNEIANADALFAIDSLKYLHLSDNQITSVPAPGGNLMLLYLAGNMLGDTAVIRNANLLYYDIGAAAGM